MTVYARTFNTYNPTYDGKTEVNVVIEIVDEATGQPTNGNGINVTYRLYIDGSGGDDLLTQVFGQSVIVYSGIIDRQVTPTQPEQI